MPSGNSALADVIQRRVAAALEEQCLAGKKLLVAVSGGPDSLALLYALARLRDDYRLELCGAHLNHKLRGSESDADAEFTADAFRQLSIPFTSDSADVAAYRSKHRLSLEDAARRARYAFLAAAADEHEADAVALGHTADDQAETVLMHIMRGSGLDGLRGMQVMDTRAIDGKSVTLFRPLLGTRRSETQAYCRDLGLEPRLDPSNMSPEFLRNRIRLELMPMLEQVNPSIGDALLRLASNAAQDSEFIRSRVDEAWDGLAKVDGSGVVRLSSTALCRQPEAIRRHILLRAIEAAGGEVSQRHILDMMALVGGAPGKVLHLSGGLSFASDYGEAYIGRSGIVSGLLAAMPSIRGERLLALPGETRVGDWHISASVATGPDVRRIRESLGSGTTEQPGSPPPIPCP